MLFNLGVPENFAKLTRKRLWVSFNKVAGLQPETLLKKRLSRVFSCDVSGIFKNIFFYRHLRATTSSCYFLSGKWWTFKKESSQDVIHFRCSWKFRQNCKKTSLLESLSIKLQGYSLKLYQKRSCHEYFPVSLAEFLRTLFFTDISGRLLLPVIFCLGSDELFRKTVFSAQCNFSEMEKWMTI